MIKKLLSIFFLSLILSSNAIAKNTKLVKENFYEGEIKYKFLNYQLPEGQWKYFDKMSFNISTIRLDCISFSQIEKKVLNGLFEICEIASGGKHAHDLGRLLVKEARSGKYDNCTLRPEYYYANLWTKGISMNCFLIFHIDLDKEFNYPDDPEDMSHLSYKRYFEKNNIVLPKTLIGSNHLFFAPNVKDKGISLDYYINPEFYGAPKTINGSESKSEYHRDNIEQYPLKKKFMDDWLIQEANYHQTFEKKLKAKSHQLLNLVQFTEKDSPKLTNENITNQLKSLNDLYKSGVLTKEEFEKAKKKILN